MTASVSPAAMDRSTPPSAVMPPNFSVRSRTSSSDSPTDRSLEERCEGLPGRDLLRGRVGGLAGAHEADGVQAVVAARTEGDAGDEPVLVVVLDGLHRGQELLAGE